MATTSNSTTQNVVQTGGQFAPSSTSARFKDTDYGKQALGTPAQLKRFFAQLNPIVQQIKTQGDTGVNIGNFDADVLSFPVAKYQSDWTPLTFQNGSTKLNGILCFDGTSPGVAVRKDGWGRVDFYASFTAGGPTGTVFTTLPSEFRPPADILVSVANGPIAFTAFTIVASTGTVAHNVAAATTFAGAICSWPSSGNAPGTVPGTFPISLKVAPGRTPAAVILMGAKPTQSVGQDVYKAPSGLLGAPVGLSWTWLSGTAPSTADAQKTNTVRIDSIPGLTTGVGYTVTVLVLYSLTGQSSGG